jgi:hypothetical protein
MTRTRREEPRIATVREALELREFLQARDEQELPGTVEAFFVTTGHQARALKNTGEALLVDCADAEIADLVRNDLLELPIQADLRLMASV